MRRSLRLTPIVLLFVVACASQQVTAYKTLGAVVTAVDTGMQIYGAQVRAGNISDADQQRVKSAYISYQGIIGPVIQARGLTGDVPDNVSVAANALLSILRELKVVK